jgi:hypothetical protein
MLFTSPRLVNTDLKTFKEHFIAWCPKTLLSASSNRKKKIAILIRREYMTCAI